MIQHRLWDSVILCFFENGNTKLNLSISYPKKAVPIFWLRSYAYNLFGELHGKLQTIKYVSKAIVMRMCTNTAELYFLQRMRITVCDGLKWQLEHNYNDNESVKLNVDNTFCFIFACTMIISNYFWCWLNQLFS